MHIKQSDLRGMSEDTLEELYDWARGKYKDCLRNRDYAWAHSFNAICGDITLELSGRYRRGLMQASPVPLKLADDPLPF